MAVRGLRLLMWLLVEQPLCRSWTGSRQLPVQVPVEPEVLPSLAALALNRFELVQVVPPQADQRLHRLHHPWWWMAELVL